MRALNSDLYMRAWALCTYDLIFLQA